MSCTFVGQLGEPNRELGDVRRAGGAVDQRDRGEEEQRRHEAHDDVRDPRPDALAGAAEREQHVARRQQDLEPDVEVEEVARDERVEHARRQDQVARIEDRHRRLAVPVGDALADGVDEHDEQHDRRDEQHDRGEAVDHEHDAERRAQPPTCTTVGSPESTATRRIAAITATLASTVELTAICARRCRPRIRAVAAPSSGSSTTRGTSAAIIGAPPHRVRLRRERMPRARAPRRAPRRSRR